MPPFNVRCTPALYLYTKLIRTDNHKPKLSQSVTTTTIKASQQPKAYNLSIKINGNGNEYLYTGTQRQVDACILIYDPNTETLSLDKLDSELNFNLVCTPSNSDSSKLEEQYPHIDDGSSEPEADVDGGLFGDDPKVSEVGDPSNPYDYRQFLHAAKHQTTASPESPSNFVPSPAPRPSIEASPLQQPLQSANRPKPRPRPQQKRPSSPPPKEEADADNEDSDDGGLIIEMEPETKKRQNRFMGAFDRDATSSGPISLRSAASSMSPATRIVRRVPSFESDQSDNMDVIDDLKLPSPRTSPPARTSQEEAEDEADLEAELENLEAELEMLLEEQASVEDEDEDDGHGINGDGGAAEVSQGVHEESSEESEEE